MLRLPIGDWSLEPYGPYVGCMDGSSDMIDWMLDMCEKYGIKVLLDVHAVKGSQNGFDNSGMTNGLTWTDSTHFSHWPINAGEWMGKWNITSNSYDNINMDNVNRMIQVSESFLKKWG